jgi:hypothetical protein
MTLHDRASRVQIDLDGPRGAMPLPDDCLRRLRRRVAPRGEMRLALAVLEDALRCLKADQGRGSFKPHWIAREAERWIESTDRGPLFSFENVCLILGLDAGNLRAWIFRWSAKRRPAPRRPSAARRRPFGGWILTFPARGDRRAGDIIQLDL